MRYTENKIISWKTGGNKKRIKKAIDEGMFDIRALAVEALGEIGDQNDIPLIAETLKKEKTRPVINAAVKALTNLGAENEYQELIGRKQKELEDKERRIAENNSKPAPSLYDVENFSKLKDEKLLHLFENKDAHTDDFIKKVTEEIEKRGGMEELKNRIFDRNEAKKIRRDEELAEEKKKREKGIGQLVIGIIILIIGIVATVQSTDNTGTTIYYGAMLLGVINLLVGLGRAVKA